MTATPVPAGSSSAKDAVRAAVRARRRARPTDQRGRCALLLAERVLALPELGRDHHRRREHAVACYASYGGEPGTGPLIERLHEAGLPVVLPVVGPGRDLHWASYDGPAALAPGPRGMPEPTGPVIGAGPEALTTLGVDLLVIPALACDPSGARLGQGGGFYDTLLAALPRSGPGRILVLALVHDDEVLAPGAIPVDAHDRPVDLVVTPTRVLRISG